MPCMCIHAASTIELGISTYRTQSNCRTLGISFEYIRIIDSLEFNFIEENEDAQSGSIHRDNSWTGTREPEKFLGI